MRDVKMGVLAVLGCGVLAGQAFAIELAPHRALYELSPARVDQAGKVMPLDGRLAYEITGSACDGYTVNYRIANRFQDPGSGSKLVDTQLNVFEAADGTQFDVEQHQLAGTDGAPAQRLSVKRTQSGGVGQGKIISPEAQTFTLAADVLFPSALEIKLLHEAEQGMSRDSSLVFDGSDGKKVLKAITFIGKKRAPGSFAIDVANVELKPLAGLASWSMSTSYFPTDATSGDTNADTADYQASFNMYENGVSSELLFDYGSYALKGKLTKLELLKPAPCDATKIKK